MAIYVCGDTHGHYNISKLNIKSWPLQRTLDEDDVLIILGDFGLVYDLQKSKEETYWLDWLCEKNCTIAFIDGNHENFDRLDLFPISTHWAGNVQVVHTGKNGRHVYRLRRGEIYNIDNKKVFTFGGALSVDKSYRKEYISWWRQESHTLEQWHIADKNLAMVNNSIDYVLTHTCPTTIAIRMGLIDVDKYQDVAGKNFDLLLPQIDFNQWHFGHWHKDNNTLPLVLDDRFFLHYNNIPFKLP